MITPLLVLRQAKTLPLRVNQISVRYASRKENIADPRVEIIRRTLYPSTIRNRASPVGTWRPDVGRRLQKAIPSVQAHETIERAWLLHQRHIRRARLAELERKFSCMKEAMDALQQLDPRLYREANKVEDPRARSPKELEALKSLKGTEQRALESRIRGLFPRELRTPTDTPPREGWRYNFKPIIELP
ncbi:hypothetical protein PHLCEN_2v2870 [Hermanssonia centrifuga]|uniref:Large ribosomal subunit protein mL40 n=1 Tax=Hermanssonia centrifuga TaxID=98765 RepID=A0A2R6RI64_9APHY|nr:hypothetical protein PHLCEN_2v2870 [Hermanssonia centrifuga]